MRSNLQRNAGRHRKVTAAQTAKGRVAIFTVAAGAVSGAGATGVAAAQVQDNADGGPSTKAQSVNFTLAANSSPLDRFNQDLSNAVDAANTAIADAAFAAPQILALAEEKPVINLQEQLHKAIEASTARAAADMAARAPQISRPAEGAFTSPFGPRWGTFHYGVDIANAPGTPILAVMDGTVVDSGPASGYGNWIRIKHDDGSLSLYGHMQSLDVAVGQRVTAGQKIAGMGSLGFSTGSHLHFEIHPDGTTPADPAAWLAEHGINL
ncbi:membrane protein [Corynebacterium phocae]|uniref:Membrane protein n=1 Tax=Corynebacterium phocae TaxID=161895 RepID=A0A1L7D4M5_9CORY|nr:M23 family metallopeptidase [Corynebacterium phocae]APT92981.1 membrane protein [Corynebacterium phocae]KAA8723319.1 M23 family metallopeptidase [Corynebacterium phocae]